VATLFWLLLFVGGALALAYRRVGLGTSTAAAGAALVAYSILGDGGAIWLLLLWALFAGLVALNLTDLRRERITRPLLSTYRKMLPSMSRTEREALEAGTVWWEGELFAGVPKWRKLLGARRRTSPRKRRRSSTAPARNCAGCWTSGRSPTSTGTCPPRSGNS
jgi:acyl-CoA dehydrogenase